MVLIAPVSGHCILVTSFNRYRQDKAYLPFEFHSITTRSVSFIRLWVNVVYRVENSKVDRLVARNPLEFF